MLKKLDNIPAKCFLTILIILVLILLINTFIINFQLPFDKEGCQNIYNIISPVISIVGIYYVVRTLRAIEKQVDEMKLQREESKNQNAFNKILEFIYKIEDDKFMIDKIGRGFLGYKETKSYDVVEMTVYLRRLIYIVVQFNRVFDYIANYNGVKTILYERLLLIHSVLYMQPLEEINNILKEYTLKNDDTNNNMLREQLIGLNDELNQIFKKIGHEVGLL